MKVFVSEYLVHISYSAMDCLTINIFDHFKKERNLNLMG